MSLHNPHSIFYNQELLRNILQHVQDKYDLCALSVVSKRVHAAGVGQLYRCVQLREGLHTGLPSHDFEERRQLLRSLENNHVLWKFVRILLVALPSDAIDVMARCPGLERLRVTIVHVRKSGFGPNQNASVEMMPVPSTVVHLEITQDTLTRLDPESLTAAFAQSSRLVKLTLYAVIETVEIILEFIGSQLTSMKLCMWGQQQSKMPAARLNALFECVPNLTSLSLFTLSYDQLEEVQLPQLLEKLTIDTAQIRVVERVLELLATNASWCPRLSYLPHFTSIVSVEYLHNTHNGQARIKTFHERCMEAQTIIESRPSLLPGSEAQFEDLRRRTTDPNAASTAPTSASSGSPDAHSTEVPLRRLPRRRSQRRRRPISRNTRRQGAVDALRQWRIRGNRRRQRSPQALV